MFKDLRIKKDEVIYIQISNYIKSIIKEGLLPIGSKLPSTRELGSILEVGRNSIVQAYDELINDGYIKTIKGKGTFVILEGKHEETFWDFSWVNKENSKGRVARNLDIVKTEKLWEKGMISFKSIAPLGELFDIDELKKSFQNRISVEEDKLLNYGYAKGYKPLIDFLNEYMKNRGIQENDKKEILITNGFTEGFDLIISSFTEKGDLILCENPTHNTALKIMKYNGVNPIGIKMYNDGLDIDDLRKKLNKNKFKFAYLIPSYHNPTGIVTPLNKRKKIYNILKESKVPIIEDGFNEELFYESSHVASISALEGEGTGVIYIGSFSKVLFPGLRIGWVYADKKVIDILESVKRCRNIHTSFLDQGILYEYLNSGVFDKYIKKVRRIYKEKYEFTVKCIKKYIPNAKVWGKGGLYVYVTIGGINSRRLLENCYQKGVLIMDSSLFEVNGEEGDSFRLGFTRLNKSEIEIGIRKIGEVLKDM